MTALALDLLAEARRHGVRLVAMPSGTIKACAPKPPPQELLAKLKEHREQLASALAAADAGDVEERAAIIEFDGDLARKWAEGFKSLNPDHPPADVPVERWRVIVNAIGTFLDRWAAEAVAKGWHAADIFGADASRPGVTWLNSGPLWFGNGADVVEVHADRIVLQMPDGARQTHYRGPHLRPRVVPWALP